MPVAPPRPKGPPLNALRAFESAARLGGFTAAADELCVTPGAIAQHVKALEAWAEAPLFKRNARGIALTPLGEDLLPEFTDAFNRLSQATQSLRTRGAPRKAAIATLPAIAQLWLSGRLGTLRRTAPDISVSVIAVETCPNLQREPFDVTLFFEEGPVERDGVEVFRDRIFPVCTPDIAARLGSARDLAGEILLRDSTWLDDWAVWLSSVPEGKGVPVRGPVFSLFSVALEEARHGAGVLIAHEELVRPALECGDLVRPFDRSVALDRYLVMRATRAFAASEAHAQLTAAFRG